VLGLIGARALERDTPVGLAAMRFGAAGELADAEAREAVGATLQELAEMVREREAYLADAA
jgi:hypothetical protein